MPEKLARSVVVTPLSFEKIEKSILAAEIEKALIGTYEINTDNVSLFANSIKILCFEKMEQRAYVTKAELDSQIQSVKIDISKGPQNPAHSWIRKLDYSKPSLDEGRISPTAGTERNIWNLWNEILRVFLRMSACR